MVELTSPYLNISIEESIGLLYSEWLLQPTEDEYWKGMNQLGECLVRYPVRYWIQESTNLAHVPLEDQRQALRQLIPRVLNSQLKKIACVIALNYNYMAMFEQLVDEEQIKVTQKLLLTGRAIEVQQFKSYKEAADWIADIKA